MNAIGLSKPAVDPSREDKCGILRSQIIHGLFTVYAVVKRVTVPSDSNVNIVILFYNVREEKISLSRLL